MKLMGKRMNFNDPPMPSISEFLKMTEEDYERSLAAYWSDYRSRSIVERLVVSLRWKWQYFKHEVLLPVPVRK